MFTVDVKQQNNQKKSSGLNKERSCNENTIVSEMVSIYLKHFADISSYDILSCRLIDCFLVDTPVTSLTMSPTSDFLATSHLDDVGVYLWSNTTLFSYVPLRPLPSDFKPQLVTMPTTKRTTGKFTCTYQIRWYFYSPSL